MNYSLLFGRFLALAAAFSIVPANAFLGLFSRPTAPKVPSIHEYLAAHEPNMHSFVSRLHSQKSTVGKFIATWHAAQRNKLIQEVAIHVPINIDQTINSALLQKNTETPITVVAQKETPKWALEIIKELARSAKLRGEKLIVTPHPKWTCARAINETNFELMLRPETFATGLKDYAAFSGVIMHEFAHIALKHAMVRNALKEELSKNPSFDLESFIEKLDHAKEFEADLYLTRSTPILIQGMCRYLRDMQIACKFPGDIESRTHPSLNRRCAALETTAKLLECEASLD